MTQFIEFSATRKAMIAHIRNRLITIKPTRDEVYGTVYHNLQLSDFAMYAAVRGADIRKCDHDVDGNQAKEALLGFKRALKYGGLAYAMKERFTGMEHTPEIAEEMIAIIDEALERAF